jgi:hypothetical protein
MKATPIIKKYFRKTGFWRKNNEEKLQVMQNVLTELNRVYNKNVQLVYEDNEFFRLVTGGGRYNINSDTIYLYRLSLMTFLHEFAHALGYDQNGAILWSHKVFKEAMPVLYRKSLQRGLFIHSPLQHAVDNFQEQEV